MAYSFGTLHLDFYGKGLRTDFIYSKNLSKNFKERFKNIFAILKSNYSLFPNILNKRIQSHRQLVCFYNQHGSVPARKNGKIEKKSSRAVIESSRIKN